MTQQPFSDEVLMAYADGELDQQTVTRLETALETNAELARRLTLFTRTRETIRASAHENPPKPLSDALRARVNGLLDEARPTETVVPMVARATPADQKPGNWRPTALAASLALAVGLGGGFAASNFLRSGADTMPLEVTLLATPGLESALADMASGETRSLPDGTLTVIASFGDVDGTLCREFEFDTSMGGSFVSVVCRGDGRWDTRLAVATASQDASSYAPASSLDTLDAYLNAIGASAVFTPEEEARALSELDR